MDLGVDTGGCWFLHVKDPSGGAEILVAGGPPSLGGVGDRSSGTRKGA